MSTQEPNYIIKYQNRKKHAKNNLYKRQYIVKIFKQNKYNKTHNILLNKYIPKI